MITIKKLQFYYDTKQILNIKNLSLDTSKISVLMGANGSGKSTFLRVLNFLEGDFSQNISYFGRYKLNAREKRQFYLLFPQPYLLNRSIRANLDFVLKVYGFDGDKKAWIEELCGLLEFDGSLFQKYPYELSSGQRQKVAFIIALGVRAKYYFLDEPSAFLDKKTSKLFKNAILKTRQNRDCGFLITSHDKEFLDDLAEVKYYLSEGEILEFENTNIFELKEGKLYFSNVLHFETKAKKIALNPYKIAIYSQQDYCIMQAKLIALRQRKDFIFVRVCSGDKILEFAMEDKKFQNETLFLNQKLNLGFNLDAICFLN